MLNHKQRYHILPVAGIVLSVLFATQAQSAVTFDRTRIVLSDEQHSVSIKIKNRNKELPYLAQSWLEDEQGHKTEEALVVVQQLQRLGPGETSKIKIQALPASRNLPQDRETLFYLNLQEIPPRSNKPNALQLALLTRIKLFYRPKAIVSASNKNPWYQQLTLIRAADSYQLDNQTPWYITLIEARQGEDGQPIDEFKPVMVAPKTQMALSTGVATLGDSPVLSYINDYGGRQHLKFICSGNYCTASPVEKIKREKANGSRQSDND